MTHLMRTHWLPFSVSLLLYIVIVPSFMATTNPSTVQQIPLVPPLCPTP